MVYGGGVLLLAQLCLIVYCVLNVLTTPDDQIRNLPKLLWLVLVLLFPVVGGVAWLVAGRPQRPAAPQPYRGSSGVPPEYDRPGRARALSPDDDEAFLRSLRERAEQQRRQAEQQRRQAEQERQAREAEPDA